MVNEERLRQLVKIAKFDTNDGKSCKPMTQYARKDYVSLQMLKSFVTGTITYAMMFAIWALYSMDTLIRKMTGNGIFEFAAKVLILYLTFMLLYMGATYIVFQVKYTEGRKKVKKYYNSLRTVNAMYERGENKTQREGD
ncbi:MAG: hypothetical protein PUB98_03605 [Clostridiales bacterium]|nr:hypothetical protein [Clostridiales bacterium]